MKKTDRHWFMEYFITQYTQRIKFRQQNETKSQNEYSVLFVKSVAKETNLAMNRSWNLFSVVSVRTLGTTLNIIILM